MSDWGYWSKPGLFTLVKDGDRLGVAEISSKEATTVRTCSGFLFDRLAWAEQAAREWSDKQFRGVFTPIGKHRVFLLEDDK